MVAASGGCCRPGKPDRRGLSRKNRKDQSRSVVVKLPLNLVIPSWREFCNSVQFATVRQAAVAHREEFPELLLALQNCECGLPELIFQFFELPLLLPVAFCSNIQSTFP